MVQSEPPRPPAPSLVGTVVADRYSILKKLGEGGMGEVYLAQDQQQQKQVALKVLLESLATDPKAVARFDKEALAVSRLNHPNIVAMIDYGRSAQGQLFLAMEYLQGVTVYDLLLRQGHLDWERSLHIARGIAAALSDAHTLGIIHRDLKPDNVMVSDDSHEVKVLDFGLAMVAESQPQMRLTESNIIMGTPGFMSPEQIDGAGVDARSDLYALGILWWQMLVGRPPFDGDTPIKVMMMHVQVQPKAPTEARPGLVMPRAGEELILKLLAKHPDERPADGATLLADIRALDESNWDVATTLPSVGKPLEDWEAAFELSAPNAAAPAPEPAAPPEPGGANPLLAGFDDGASIDDEVSSWSPPPESEPDPGAPGMVIRADGTIERPGAPPQQAFDLSAPLGYTPPEPEPEPDASAMGAINSGFDLQLDDGQPEERAPTREAPREPRPARAVDVRAPEELSEPTAARPTWGGRDRQPETNRRWLLAVPVVIVALALVGGFVERERLLKMWAEYQGEPGPAVDDPLAVHLDGWRASLGEDPRSVADLLAAGTAALADDTLASREAADVAFRRALLVERHNAEAIAGLLEVALLPPMSEARASLPADPLLEEIATVKGPAARRARAAWRLVRGDAGGAGRILRGLNEPQAIALVAQARFATDPLKALSRSKEAYEGAPSSRAATVYAHIAQQLGYRRDANRALRSRLAHEPKDPDARTVKAELLLDDGEATRGAQLLNAVLLEFPRSQRARRLLALTRGDPAAVAKELDHFPAYPPGDEAARGIALRVAALTSAGDPIAGVEAGEGFVDRLQPSAALSYAIGDAELQARRLQRARSAFTRAEEIASQTDQRVAAFAARRLGDLELTTGAFDRAIGHYARALDLDPDHVYARVGAAVAQLRVSGEAGGAEALAALTSDPFVASRHLPPHGGARVDPREVYGRLIPKQGKVAKSLRGITSFLAGDFASAEKSLRRAKGDAEKVWYAAALVAQRKSRASKAIAKLPGLDEVPHLMLIRARVDIAAGRARKVKDRLEPLRADARYGGQAEVIIGKAMHKLGRRETARGHLRAALGLDPHNIEARALMRGL